MTELTPEQVTAYLDRIRLPEAYRARLRDGPRGIHALEAVTTLQQYHLANIPFENLDLHYTTHHSLPQELGLVYETLVNRRRGGTCAQVHYLFAQLVRAFGFLAYCTGGRINAAASLLADPNGDRSRIAYGPWVHVVTIITIGSCNYVVDTNNGPSGFPYPVPLSQGEATADAWGREGRAIHESIPGWLHPEQKWWRLQQRRSHIAEDAWMDVYAFTETEWLPVDLEMLRTAYVVLGTGWVAPRVTCFRAILEEDKAVGWIMLWEDELKRHYRGKTETLQKLYSEADRVTVLADEFDIVLTEEEQKAIAGFSTEIKGDDFNFYG